MSYTKGIHVSHRTRTVSYVQYQSRSGIFKYPSSSYLLDVAYTHYTLGANPHEYMEEGVYIGQRYDSLSARWKRSTHQISIVIIGLEERIKIPLAFLQETQIDSWETLNWFLNCLVNERGHLIASDGRSVRGGVVLEPSERTRAGNFLFVPVETGTTLQHICVHLGICSYIYFTQRAYTLHGTEDQKAARSVK